jgi:multiple sugar transport system substrate-binding protein
MLTRKKGYYFLTSILILILLSTACSSTSNNSDGSNGEVVLTFSTWQMDQEGYGEFWKEAIDAFNKEHEGVKIEPYNIDPSGYPDRLLVDIVGGNAPDLAMTAGFDFPQLASMNAFEPLNEIIDLNLSDFHENLIDYGTVDNKLLGYPVMSRSLQLLYNKELLEKHGITEPPSTPEEFYEAVTKLKNESANQYGFGFDTNNTRYLYEDALIWALGFGGNFAENGKPTLSDPKTVEGLEFLDRLVDEKLIPQGLSKSDVRLGFAQGNIAMIIDGAWILPIVEEQNPDLLDSIGAAPTPFPSEVTTGGTMNLVSISSQSEHKEEAAEFIEWIAQPEWQVKWFELTKTLPAGKNILQTKHFEEDPRLASYVDSLQNAVPIAPQGLEKNYNEFSGIVQEKITAAFFTKDKMEDLLREADKEIEGTILK